ncbi:MAG: hypothetical protein R2867_03150 [Caldilineaceae bacterium]
MPIAEGSEYEWTGAKTPIPNADTELKTLPRCGTMVPQGVKDVAKRWWRGCCAWGAATEMDGPTRMSIMTPNMPKSRPLAMPYFRPLRTGNCQLFP